MNTNEKLTPAELAARRRARGGNLTHGDRRTKRNRDRSSQKRAAIREQA